MTVDERPEARPDVARATPAREPQPSRSASPRVVEFAIDPRRWILGLFLFCLSCEILLVLLDYHVNYRRRIGYGPIRRLFNITREDGLASWFGVTQVFLVALTVWLIWLIVRRGTSRRAKVGWLVLALFFTWMAVDDGALIHERMGSTFAQMQRHADESELAASVQRAFPSYDWQLLLVPLFGLGGLFLLLFLWFELRSTSTRLLVFGAVACFVVAVGLDFIEGLEQEHPWNVYRKIAERWDFEELTERLFRRDSFDTLVHFSKSVEEFIEMLGMTVLWTVFLGYLARISGELRVRFRDRDRSPDRSAV